MTEWVIYFNTLNPEHRWDLMRLDEMFAPGCPYPPCDHATAQEAFNCLLTNMHVTRFRLEVRPHLETV